MSLRCLFNQCARYELANANQLAFYQDVNNEGWNLGLAPSYSENGPTTPATLNLIDSGNSHTPYTVICARCQAHVGKVNKICGFEKATVNFSARKVALLQSSNCAVNAGASKWSKLVTQFPQIKKLTASIPTNAHLIGSDTIHFHGLADIQQMIQAGKAVEQRADITPHRYQWRAYFFACLHNTLLCLPTGMGKTLIANLLMRAYRSRNPDKGQVFIVPTVVLVDQQASTIERTTGFTVQRRSGEHKNEAPWSANEICVCTPAIFNNAMKMRMIDMSQLALLVLDEVHEGNSDLSEYGLILPYINKCSPQHRPRVLGLTASPAGITTDLPQAVRSACKKLFAKLFMPLMDDDKNTHSANEVAATYISIPKSPFDIAFESFVFDSLDKFATLHDYFKSSWKEIPKNAILVTKHNTAVKMIVLAQQVARHNNDLPLMQLSQWMNKWVDSLDMLQIFGPRQLLNYIRTDMDFVTSGYCDTLSKISGQLAPHLAHIKLKLAQLEREYYIAPDSPRVTELLNQLRRFRTPEGNQQRILVFVDRRSTAERLSRRLKDDPDIGQMNPDFIVGNSAEGIPKEAQQQVLSDFHEGKCQLLIATSVLEQGIDVAACGVVICYDGVKSLKSIIQSRGRARKKFAKFIAFVSAEGQRKVNQLTEMEVSMNYTLKALMHECGSSFDQQLNQEIEKFLETGDDLQVQSELQFHEDDDDEELEEDLEIPENVNFVVLRFFKFVDSEALAEHISSFFTSRYDRYKIMRRKVVAYFSVPDEGNDGTQIIKNISSPFDNSTNCRSWIEIVHPDQDNSMSNKRVNGIKFNVLTGFHFSDHVTVGLDPEYIWTGNFMLKIYESSIVLERETTRFIIKRSDLDGPILMNDTNGLLEIFLNLRVPPAYWDDEDLAPYHFEGRSFNLYLKKNSSVDTETARAIRSYLHCFGQVYNVCHLKIEKFNAPVGSNELSETKDPNAFEKNYFIRAWHSKHAAVLPPKLPINVLNQFHLCQATVDLEILLNNTVPVRFERLNIQQVREVDLPFDVSRVGKNHELFGRVKVTPSRLIFMPMQPVATNRIFRYYPNRDNFLLTSFDDEHDGNPWRSPKVNHRFRQILMSGIRVGEKIFTFLGCSNSQLREGRCWFSCLNRQEVYDKIGTFPNDMGAGRKLTRLALAFASSIETVAVDHRRYLENVSDDVVQGEVNFSDGIGRASRGFFKRILAVLDKPSHISAVQIRVGGIKGVLSVYDEQDEDIVIRKSMKKFESDHNIIEVLNYSRSSPLYLNKHVILLLSSFGIEDKAFLDLQFNQLTECMDALTDDESSLVFVRNNAQIFKWETFPAQVIDEPFFRQLLFSNSIQFISDIASNAHLAVEEGRVLMGVLDETQTLEYGQVYAQIVEDGVTFEIEGKVVVFRNPAVLPSDIRVLEATKNVSPRVKALYKNCLVIPAKGPASHAHECSGGDLDGDLYYIIWDKKLVPPTLPIPGSRVVEVKTIEPIVEKDGSIQAMMNFYCDYVSNNKLGVIANAHLATADKHGMSDKKSLELARYVVAETDAPKKGFTVGEISKDLMPTEYPDYMNKSDKASYQSARVLGEMFRRAKPLLEVLLEKRVFSAPHSRVNLAIDKQTIESYYSLYSFGIRRLLQTFELQSEVDLFSGTPMWMKGPRSAFKLHTQLRETVKEIVGEFWLKWRNIFEAWRIKVRNDQQQIIEWYRRPRSDSKPIYSFSFLALPFVVFEECKKKTITENIQISTMRWMYREKMQWLDEWRKRNQVGMKIMRKLEDIECHYYGSSMLGLNEEYSDVDLFADEANMQSLEKVLRDMDKNLVSMKKPHPCVRLTVDRLPVDVTNFIGGVQKTYALAETFDEHPGLWAALRVLIEWARTVKLVKSGGSQGLITVVSFCHLFVQLTTSQPLRKTLAQKPYTLARYNGWIESLSGSQCGKYIYNFLKTISNRNNKKIIERMEDPISGLTLVKADAMETLCQNAEVAAYILSVHDGDIQKMIQFTAKNRLFRVDKRYLSTEDNPGKFQQCYREIQAKCNPTKSKDLTLELRDRNGVYYLEVNGDYKLFAAVEKGLNKIHTRTASARISGLKKLNTYHVVNSTMILPEFGNGPSTEVSFSPYENDFFHLQHTGIYKHVLKTKISFKNVNWMVLEYQRYEKKFIDQLRLFRRKHSYAKPGTRAWRFFGDLKCTIRCGQHYMFNIPETLHNTFETITLGQIERTIAKLEEGLNVEQQQNIARDYQRNYNALTLLRALPDSAAESTKNHLQLKPLQAVKEKRKEMQISSQMAVEKKKNVSMMSHTFYPHWMHGESLVEKFATANGFRVAPLVDDDSYATVSVYWRQRELVLACDQRGIMQHIRHRRSRWLSATFKRNDNSKGDDIRAYLETHALLDEDESCLETVVEYLQGRSIFTDEFLAQLGQIATGDVDQLATKPLISEMFHLNFRFRSLRYIKGVRKFVNDYNDFVVTQRIADGVFRNESREFEWNKEHDETEIRLAMESKRTDEDLCKQSYSLSTKLFEITKTA